MAGNFVEKEKKEKKRKAGINVSDIYRGVVAGTAAAGVGVVAIEGLFPEGGLLLGLPEGFFDLGALSCCCCCFCCCLHLALRFLNHTYGTCNINW